MANWRQRLKSRAALCALWVALCFGLTSAAYLSWLHRLTALALGTAADWLSMGAGYLLQAAGMGIAAQRLRRAPDADHSRTFAACALLFAALCAPALLGVSAAAVIAFGLGMNLACGIIAGYYLFAIAGAVEPGHRGFAFGGGYALATVAVGLLALVGRGAFLHGPWALLLVIALAAVAAVFARRSGLFGPFEAAPEPDQPPRPAPDGLVALAFGTIVLISAVKNLGFAFPSADIQAGLVPELSRLPYALGLAVAGVIGDRDRRHGMLCTMAALILPFIIMYTVMQNEPDEEQRRRMERMISYMLILGMLATSFAGFVRIYNYTRVFYLVLMATFVYTLFWQKRHMIIRLGALAGVLLLTLLQYMIPYQTTHTHYYDFFYPYTCILDEDHSVYFREVAHVEAVEAQASDENVREIK